MKITERVGHNCVAVKSNMTSIFQLLQDRWESVELGKVGYTVLLSFPL